MSFNHFSKADFEAMEQRYRAAFFNSLSGFKPLNLVGSVGADGQTNLAIFSSVFHLGSHPALMGMILRPDSVERHTLQNIQSVGWYTLNHVHTDIYEKAHQTSARYPREVSEFDACGLTAVYTDLCKAPYVSESHVRMGLRLLEINPIRANGTYLVIGSVEEVILPDSAPGPDGYIDIEQAGTIAGSGLDGYHKTERITRLGYAKP
jgi:flavin reductase (DIM6/NTAB) family NADH-FMN oxidoreductase RutF